MAVLGIKNLDAITKRIELMSKACQPAVLDKALEAAGDVLADALAAGTPVGNQSHRPGKAKGRQPGNARDSVINVSARSKQYGLTRRLIGYSKKAYYMLWVIKGHQIVAGGTRGKIGSGRLARKASTATNTHSQGGKGRVVGHVPGRDFMSGIFKANIKRAMEAAREVIRKAAQTGNVGKAA
jgi:hypothetical protein